MFEFLPITNTQRKEMTVWAEGVIEKNKQAMRSGEAYLLWENRLWYRKEGDAWIDESWWLETAKQWWIRYKDEYSGMGTRVNQALEILVFHFPEEYREYIRQKIDNWYDTEGYHDPGYYWDLIEAVYPDHPVTQLLFEEQENDYERSLAIRLGNLQIAYALKEDLLSELAENNIYRVNQILTSLGKQTTNNIFSENELDRIRGAMLATARKEISINEDNDDRNDLHSVLPSAIMMEWQEILNALIDNSSYLTTLLEFFKESNYDDILRWSLTDNCKLVENIVFQLKSEPSSIEEYHQRSFPSHYFALAVAWKRSQHF